MDTIKHLLFKQFKTFSILSISMVLSIALLMVRAKLNHSFFYLFLVWNLFLAVIPFAITTYLASAPKRNTLSLALWFGVWLLFLPNAPYMITDLLHLKASGTYLLWLDILVVMSFAFNGLIMFYLSLIEMKNILKDVIKEKPLNYIVSTIIYLTGFGVYLGRFLRYNSWEILSRPYILLNDVLNIIIQPYYYKEAWLFTMLFGTFLSVGYWIFKEIYSKPST